MKKIDDELGGTTPLNIILKFPTSKRKVKKSKMMMNLMNGKKKTKIVMKINQNIGLQEIKWTKF